MQRVPTWLVALATGFGFALHVYVALFEVEGGFDLFGAGLLIWSWLPYLLCLLVALVGPRRADLGFGGALAALVIDLATFHAVFVAPTSSTAAIALLFMPLFNLVVSVPLGMLAAWGLGRFRSRGADSGHSG